MSVVMDRCESQPEVVDRDGPTAVAKRILPGDKEEKTIGDDFQWEYLEFDTSLPDFTTMISESSLIKPPNLQKYGNPFEWSRPQKNVTLFLCCISTFLAAYGAGEYGFTGETLRSEWNLSLVAFETGLTVFAFGFAIAPMFLAPFTEINGRRPVFLLSGLLLLIATIGCAVTDSFAGMLIARLFAGIGSSTYSTIIGGVIADVWQSKDRNVPMAVYSGFALGGTGMGPLISGIICDRVSWRWVFYSHAISVAVVLCCQLLLFKETRGSILLSRRAKAINSYYDILDEHTKQTGSPRVSPKIRYKVLADEQRQSLAEMLRVSLTRPFIMLSTEPVVFFFSLWAAFAWGVLYMTFNVLSLVFQARHNFTLTGQAGVFAAMVIGVIVATLLSVYHERIAAKHLPGMSASPEGRLYFTCIEAMLLPIGLFWFGWTSYSSIHWIVPTIAIGFATIGVYSVYLAVFNYLADVYHRYASSALAGQSFCRNTFGAVFPLFTSQMFLALDFPGASSLLGGIGLVLTLVPWVLVFKGPQIRARSKLASEIMSTAH